VQASWVVSSKINIILIAITIAGLGILYKLFNPANFPFPQCPFLMVTGYQCPGCGSQRAVHHLLNFDFSSAFALNPLLIISMPYILLGFALEKLPPNNNRLKWRKLLYGQHAIIICLVIVLLFWAARNFIPLH
jgi:hypothetical protein